MKITHHAVERFLQRVMNIKNVKQQDIQKAYIFLEKETKNIVVNGYKSYFALPSFKQYKAVVIDGSIVTILPRNYKANICYKS